MEQLLNISLPSNDKPDKNKERDDRDREGGAGGKDREKNDGSRKVSSPSRLNADELPTADEKERDDYEILKIFDGNNSIRNLVFRTASVPKTATVEQIRDIAMRRFHISDNPENYYVTQAPFEGKLTLFKTQTNIQ